ncbi:hypothetical protein M3Y99_01685300 [Aphelenchoides fujianensis]|nr:hypothetical protein M3Y99_01685300 [Aphelenchoides fujianensis]
MSSEVAVVDGAAGDSLPGASIAEKPTEIDAQQPPAPAALHSATAGRRRARGRSEHDPRRPLRFLPQAGRRTVDVGAPEARPQPGGGEPQIPRGRRLQPPVRRLPGSEQGAEEGDPRRRNRQIPAPEVFDERGGRGGENEADEANAPATNGSANRTELVRKKVELKHAKKSLTLIQIEPATTAALSRLFLPAESRNCWLHSERSRLPNAPFRGREAGHSRADLRPVQRRGDDARGRATRRIRPLRRAAQRESPRPTCSAITIGSSPPRSLPRFRTLSVRKMLEHSSGAKPTEDAERMEAEEADGEQKHPNGRVMTESDIAFRDEKNRQTAEALEWFANERTPDFGDYDALFVVCRNAASISVLEHTFRAVRSSGNIVVYSPNSADIATSPRVPGEPRLCVRGHAARPCAARSKSSSTAPIRSCSRSRPAASSSPQFAALLALIVLVNERLFSLFVEFSHLFVDPPIG